MPPLAICGQLKMQNVLKTEYSLKGKISPPRRTPSEHVRHVVTRPKVPVRHLIDRRSRLSLIESRRPSKNIMYWSHLAQKCPHGGARAIARAPRDHVCGKADSSTYQLHSFGVPGWCRTCATRPQVRQRTIFREVPHSNTWHVARA